MWRTTVGENDISDGANYFNPRPPCGGRHHPLAHLSMGFTFQSTSPVWRTTKKIPPKPRCYEFQSTSPVWRTTLVLVVNPTCGRDFNPRPPCGGRLVKCGAGVNYVYFNPRPPCGGRRLQKQKRATRKSFQSTSPVWRTTFTKDLYKKQVPISIHVPRVEDDQGQNSRHKT